MKRIHPIELAIYFVFGLMVATVFTLHIINHSGKHSIKIIEQTTDERGLISVVVLDNGREYAYDYLTQEEYNNLVK